MTNFFRYLRKAWNHTKEEGLAAFLTKFVYIILILIFDYIGKFRPNFKNANQIVCGTRLGSGYEGNSRYMYEWLLTNHTDISPIWLTKDKDVYERLHSQGDPVEMAGSLSGLLSLARAEVALLTHSSLDVSLVHHYIDSITWIHLGHGNPVKYGPDDEYNPEREQKWNGIDHIVVKSEFDAELKRKRQPVEIPLYKFEYLGYPRNDLLLQPPQAVKDQWENFLNEHDSEFVILYAPTQRQPNRTEELETVDLFPFYDFSIEELDDLLASINSLLLIKLHPSDDQRIRDDTYTYKTGADVDGLQSFIEILGDLSNVEYISSEHNISDPNHLLPFTDLLITDYSSIYHDYLLMDRPILFIPYDYEEFKKEFGFIYDFEDHLPGTAVDSFTEFSAKVREVATGGDLNPTERRNLTREIHANIDSKSRERVTDLIEKILNQPN